KTIAGQAPLPESPEWAQAAQGAGTMLGAAELPNVVSGVGKVAGPLASKVFRSNGLDAPTVNRWMDVPAKEVSHGANPAQQLLDEKLLGPTRRATKVNVDQALADSSQKLQGHLERGTQSGVTIDAQTPTYDATLGAIKKLGSPRDATFQAQMNGIVD